MTPDEDRILVVRVLLSEGVEGITGNIACNTCALSSSADVHSVKVGDCAYRKIFGAMFAVKVCVGELNELQSGLFPAILTSIPRLITNAFAEWMNLFPIACNDVQ